MEFNFDAVMQDAQKALESNNGGGSSDYKHKLVYPQVGNITLKMIFNTKSNTVKRLINRHTIGDEKIACLRTWNQPCPICKMIDDINNAKGTQIPGKSIARGIMFAEYISSSYPIEGVNPGDVVLFMFPYTVSRDLGQIIAQAKTPADIQKLMASNDGFTVVVTRSTDNKYSTQLGAFSTHKSKATDEEYFQMMENLESLNDTLLPAEPTEKILKDATEVAQELQAKYLANATGPVYQQQPQSQMPINMSSYGGAQPQFQQQQFQQQQFQQPSMQQPPQWNQPAQPPVQPPTSNNAGLPPCYATHGSVDPNTCMLCPHEVQCMGSTNK